MSTLFNNRLERRGPLWGRRTPAVLRACMSVVAFAAGPLHLSAQARPDSLRLEVSDLRRLARVLDQLRADPEADTLAAIGDRYLQSASAGLREYVRAFGVTPITIRHALRTSPRSYADLDRLADRILERRPAFEEAVARLRMMVEGAEVLPLWFVAGHNGAGGLARPAGALLAAERYADSVDELIPLALHELAHINQAARQGLATYRRVYEGEPVLLALALREGTADLIAELTTGRHINPRAERYGLLHETRLWSEFHASRAGPPGSWMFRRPEEPGRPYDLGYWMGYRIARTRYDLSSDKTGAIAEMLGLVDFEGFLTRSGYQGTSADRDSTDRRRLLRLLEGQWLSVDSWRNRAGDTVVERGRRRCEWILLRSRMECETSATAASGVGRSYRFVFSWDSRRQAYEYMNFASDFPGHETWYGNPGAEPGRWVFDVAQPQEREGVQRWSRHELAFEGPDRIVWRGFARYSNAPERGWEGTFVDVMERLPGS